MSALAEIRYEDFDALLIPRKAWRGWSLNSGTVMVDRRRVRRQIRRLGSVVLKSKQPSELRAYWVRMIRRMDLHL